MKNIYSGGEEIILSAVWESSSDAMRITDSKGIVINVNTAYCELTSFKPNELIGKPFEYIYEKASQKGLRDYYNEFINSGKINERSDNTYTFINGKKYHLEASYSFLKTSEEKYVLCIIRDITTFMKAIEVEKESREIYRLLTEVAKDMIFIFNLLGEVTYCNPVTLKYSGLSEDNYRGKKFIDFVPEKYHPMIQSYMEERMAGYLGSRLYELEIIDPTGKLIPIEINTTPILVSGKIKSILTIARDVSERKIAEKALKESEETFHRLFDESADSILLLNKSGFVDCNQATVSLLGYSSKAEFLKKQPWEISPEKQPDGNLSSEKAVQMIEKAQKDGYNRFEWVHTKSDGTGVPVEVMLTPIILKGEQYYYTIWRDITERKESRKKLESLNEQLVTLIEAIPDAIIFKDGKGRWLITNEFAKELFKLHDYDWYGKTDEDMLKERKEFERIYKDCITTDEITWRQKRLSVFEETLADDNGNIHNFELSKVPLFGKNGKRKALVVVGMETTQRKKAEEEIRKLSSAVEQSPASIVITDLNGSIVYANPKAAETTEYSLEELMGKNPSILQSGKNQKEVYEELWKAISSGKEWRGEFHNKKKGGELYWEQAAISPILDSEGKATHYLAVKEDITERKNIISELKLAKEKAEEGNRLKTAFMQNISHEIRTPLNGIMGFGQMMSEPDLSSEQREQYLEILNESCQRLMRTITDYMDISLIVSNTININTKSFEINSLLNELRNRYLKQCNSKRLKLSLGIPQNRKEQSICTDKELLQKVLSQIIDNSVKFTDEGSIDFGYEVEKDSLIFYVKDTGIGISQSAKEHIFSHFSQEEISTARRYEGSGLGLSIAKGYIELLGGNIWLESEKGVGSKFMFTIPIGKADTITPKKDASKINKNKSAPVILCVEDEVTNARYIETILKRKSTFYLAKNGIEAVKLFKEHPEISIILMDLKMPEMDGFEATRQIKNIRQDVPIIAVTAYAQSGDEQKALDAGCNDYLTKPLERDLLFRKIEEHLKIKL
jgi:PAS domain S-box-containing protein